MPLPPYTLKVDHGRQLEDGVKGRVHLVMCVLSSIYLCYTMPGTNAEGCLLLFFVQVRQRLEECHHIVVDWDCNANPLSTGHQSLVWVVWHSVALFGVMFQESSYRGIVRQVVFRGGCSLLEIVFLG